MSHLCPRLNSLLVPSLYGRRIRHVPVPRGRSTPLSSQQRRTILSAAIESLKPGFDNAVQVSQSVFLSVHSSGMPWYLTIPLVAFGFNVACRLPIQLYMRKLSNKRVALKPLTTAWEARYAAASSAGPPSQKLGRFFRMAELSRRRIYKAWGVQLWKNLYQLASMLPFVLFSEALRRLVGISFFQGTGEPAEAAPAAVVAAASQSVGAAAPVLVETSAVDASLQAGGMLWFSDLTLADPYMGLPLVCSALLAANVFSHLSVKQWQEILRGNKPGESVTQKIMKSVARVSIFMPLFPLLYASLPAAVHLYWTTNFAMQLFNVNFVRHILPKPTSLLQWKPTQHKTTAFINRNNSKVARLKHAASVQDKK